MELLESRARRALATVALCSAALLATTDAVRAANLTRILVSPTSRDLRLGDGKAFRALAEYDDGSYGHDITASVNWGSTVPAVATVTGGVVATLGTGETRIVAIDPVSGIESDASTGIVRVVNDLSSISLTPAKRILPVRRRTRFKAWGSFEDDVVVNLLGEATFSISDPTIASITDTGLARGLTPGQATVSAVDAATGISTTDSGDDVVLTVVGELQELSLVPERIALSVGEVTDLEARGRFEGNCKWLDFGSRLRWTSSDRETVSVTRDGVIECLKEGSAIISIRDRRVSSAETERDAEVVCGGDVVAIEVSPQSFVVPVGEKRGLEATFVFADGSRADATRSVVFSSSDPSVFEVFQPTGRDEGEGRALTTGEATIVATDPVRGIRSEDPGGRSGTIHVPGALVELTVDTIPSGGFPVAGEPGTSVRLNAVAHFENGLARAVKKLAAWSSSDEDVAAIPTGFTCPKTGQIDLLAEGEATISITYPKEGGPGSVTRDVPIVVDFPGSSASRAFLVSSDDLF